MRLKVPLFLLAALLIAVLAAGCGGDDGSNDSASADNAAASEDSSNGGGDGSSSAEEPIATASLTKAQYVKRAEAICTRNREEREKALESYREDNEETLKKGGGGFEDSLQDVYLPSKEEENEELRALGAPAGDEEKVEAFLTAFEQFVEAAKELEGAPTEDVNRVAIRAGNLAGNYGLVECTYG